MATSLSCDTADVDKWRQAFMKNEICLVDTLTFDLKAASVLTERAGLMAVEGPPALMLTETNLTKAHKVQSILAKLETSGADGYARFLSALSSLKQNHLYAKVAKQITASMHRIMHDSTAEENVVSCRGIGFLPPPPMGSVGVLDAAYNRACSCRPKLLPSALENGTDCADEMDHDSQCMCCTIHFEECCAKLGINTHPQDVVFGPGLIKPSGVLLRKSYRVLYTTLFRTAWDGQDAKANAMVNNILSRNIATDLKVISLEVIHTVDWKSDLKKLELALAMAKSGTCENAGILTCRILRRLAGLHYRARNLQMASDYNQQALQLAEGIMPDIDTIYTFRLQALLLFEHFKETKEESMRQGM